MSRRSGKLLISPQIKDIIQGKTNFMDISKDKGDVLILSMYEKMNLITLLKNTKVGLKGALSLQWFLYDMFVS